MATIYLVRHGEVAGNFGARLFFSGWDDVALNERGAAQAARVSKYLESAAKLRAIYSSDLRRASDTAHPIAALQGLPVLENPAWREIHFGRWAGCSEADLLQGWPELWRRRQADPVNVRPPDGESLNDLWSRVQPAWLDVVSRCETGDADVAVVAHQGTIRAILLSLLDAPLERYRSLVVSNGSVSRVTVARTRVSITGVNDVSHLVGL
jgi:broad specificity phosphatase PhoE